MNREDRRDIALGLYLLREFKTANLLDGEEKTNIHVQISLLVREAEVAQEYNEWTQNPPPLQVLPRQ